MVVNSDGVPDDSMSATVFAGWLITTASVLVFLVVYRRPLLRAAHETLIAVGTMIWVPICMSYAWRSDRDARRRAKNSPHVPTEHELLVHKYEQWFG